MEESNGPDFNRLQTDPKDKSGLSSSVQVKENFDPYLTAKITYFTNFIDRRIFLVTVALIWIGLNVVLVVLTYEYLYFLFCLVIVHSPK